MKEISIENIQNRVESLSEKPIVKYASYFAIGVFGIYILGKVVLPVVTTFVIEMKSLRKAMQQPS